jgi:hypothetical protein
MMGKRCIPRDRLFFAWLGLQAAQQAGRAICDFIRCGHKDCCVGTRGCGEPTDLASALPRSGVDFPLQGRLISAVKGMNALAHGSAKALFKLIERLQPSLAGIVEHIPLR